MGNKQSSGGTPLAQQLQQKKLKKTKKKVQSDETPVIKVEGFGSYFGHGQIVDKPANPMLSTEFDYPHRDKLCYYRDERLVMTKEEISEIHLAVEQANARSKSKTVQTTDAVTIPAPVVTTASENNTVPSGTPVAVSPTATSTAQIASSISTPSPTPVDPPPTSTPANSMGLSGTHQSISPAATNATQIAAAATATSSSSDCPVATSAPKTAVSGGLDAVVSDVQARLNKLATGKPIKLIIDTDIGTDCDDVLALLTCLNMPAADVNLLAVTTCYHPTLLRKHVAQSILRAAGGRFAHIPVFAGPSRLCGTHRMFFHNGNEGEGLGLSDEEKTALWEEQKSNEAVEFLRKTVAAHPGEVVIAAIGTGTNIGLCGHRYADFEAQVRIDTFVTCFPKYNRHISFLCDRLATLYSWVGAACSPGGCGTTPGLGHNHRRSSCQSTRGWP